MSQNLASVSPKAGSTTLQQQVSYDNCLNILSKDHVVLMNDVADQDFKKRKMGPAALGNYKAILPMEERWDQREKSDQKAGQKPIFFHYFGDKPTEKKRKKHPHRNGMSCISCGVDTTTEWRRGPDGRVSVCNACGLRYAKSLKREKEQKDKGEKNSLLSIQNLLN
eukprot:TRINITY_DN3616_c0_g1_i2.p1 TRINITY_DN3616_c0_g1~~TRINITY_DN3616_c0_g1_i2.p1  ORF type:complete len:183 (-),score=61.51 TRINITY_DN3616_c0_g1_i2:122-619(-)